MSEITKLYENCNIKPKQEGYCDWDSDCPYPRLIIHYDGQEPLKITGKDFIETFAKLVNTYWQDLTEEEKQQVKGILE